MVSVIIPVYNEEKSIEDCLLSLKKQSFEDFETIVIDDGSKDSSISKIQKHKVILLRQNHKGPGPARNLGAKKAKGQVLVFADADMTFHKDFIKDLTLPILQKKSKGTFTRNEYVSNWDNDWAKCWNWNQGINNNLRIPGSYGDYSPVFRAILKSEFDRVKGFDDIGFTDDWSLSRKLGYRATAAIKAVCYHRNPESIKEIYQSARWIGKNEFISGNVIRKIASLLRFNPATQLFRSIFISIANKNIKYLFFSLIYYSGITLSVVLSITGEKRSK